MKNNTTTAQEIQASGPGKDGSFYQVAMRSSVGNDGNKLSSLSELSLDYGGTMGSHFRNRQH